MTYYKYKTDDDLMVSASQNPDGSLVVVIFNEGLSEKHFNLNLSLQTHTLSISPQGLQTIILKN